MKVLVMGGTRFMGLQAVRQLLMGGHEITIVHRGSRPHPFGAEVTEILGDRDDPATLTRLAASSLDAVLDFSAYRAAQTASLLTALPTIARWVHCSTGALYDPSPLFPWPEESPYGPWPLWGDYGREKMGCEQLLQIMRPVGTVTISIRPPYVLGPANYASREEFVFNRLLDSEPIFIEGDGKAPLQMTTATDAGRVFARAVTLPFNSGFNAINIGMDHWCSSLGFIQLCGQIAGREPSIIHLPAANPGAPFNMIDHLFPFPDEPYVLSTEKLHTSRLLSVEESQSLMEVINESYEFLMAHPERRIWSRYPSEQQALDSL